MTDFADHFIDLLYVLWAAKRKLLSQSLNSVFLIRLHLVMSHRLLEFSCFLFFFRVDWLLTLFSGPTFVRAFFWHWVEIGMYMLNGKPVSGALPVFLVTISTWRFPTMLNRVLKQCKVEVAVVGPVEVSVGIELSPLHAGCHRMVRHLGVICLILEGVGCANSGNSIIKRCSVFFWNGTFDSGSNSFGFSVRTFLRWLGFDGFLAQTVMRRPVF